MDVLDFIAGLIVYGVTAPHATSAMFRYKEGDKVKYTPVGGMMPPSLKDTCPKNEPVRRWTGVVEYLDELSMAVLRYCR
jgi:hypothetical protein